MPPARIDNNQIPPLALKHLHPLLRNNSGVRLAVAPIKGNLRLCGVLLELVKRARAKGVGANQRRLPALFFVPPRELCAGGGFPRTLQAHEHDDGGFPLAQRDVTQAGDVAAGLSGEALAAAAVAAGAGGVVVVVVALLLLACRRRPAVEHGAQLVKHSFFDDAAAVDAARQLLHVDAPLDARPQRADQPNVDVRL